VGIFFFSLPFWSAVSGPIGEIFVVFTRWLMCGHPPSPGWRAAAASEYDIMSNHHQPPAVSNNGSTLSSNRECLPMETIIFSPRENLAMAEANS
jgi:hypothetical protein